MSYLVMECRAGYAVVLDDQGRFQKVPNLGYEVGQQLDSVVILPEKNKTVLPFGRRLVSLVAAAACFCLLFLGSNQLLLTSYGTVRLQINPDVLLEMNRLDYVIGLTGMNEDGSKLIEGYRYRGKRLEAVSEELADLAVKEGFLHDGGKITLTVESKNEKWRTDKETVLPEKISTYMGNKVTVHLSDEELGQDDEDDDDDGDDEDDRHETRGMKPPAILPGVPEPEGNPVSHTVDDEDDRDDADDDREDMDDADDVDDDREDMDDDDDDDHDDVRDNHDGMKDDRNDTDDDHDDAEDDIDEEDDRDDGDDDGDNDDSDNDDSGDDEDDDDDDDD